MTNTQNHAHAKYTPNVPITQVLSEALGEVIPFTHCKIHSFVMQNQTFSSRRTRICATQGLEKDYLFIVFNDKNQNYIKVLGHNTGNPLEWVPVALGNAVVDQIDLFFTIAPCFAIYQADTSTLEKL